MKDFFKRYSYQSVHLFLNQVAIGLFGMVLALAAGMAESTPLKIATSVFAILFYLFLQFAAGWKAGADDRVSFDLGKRKKDVLVPVKMWALASSLNFLLAIFVALAMWFPDAEILSGVGAVSRVVKFIIEGMYTGVLSLEVGGVALNSLWFVHFVTPLPALLALVASYLFGLNNVNFGGLFSQNSVRK